MNNQSFNSLFYPRICRNNHSESILYCRITVNSKRVEFSLNYKIQSSQWNSAKREVKGNSKDAQTINRHLSQISNEFKSLFFHLSNENVKITAKLLVAKFLKTDQQENTLIKFIDYHNHTAKHTLTWGTLKNYFTTRNYIENFLIKYYKTNDIEFNQLSFKWLSEFEIFLRTFKDKNNQVMMGNNTVMKHIERLRKIINLAIKMEIIEKDPFKSFKKKFIKNERDYLTTDELLTLESTKLICNRLAYVKDLFVFSCYTGLAYIDVMSLKPENIVLGIDGRYWIYSTRIKTNSVLKIPLFTKALDIINKYRQSPKAINEGTIFYRISNQKLNAYLKEIAKALHINKNITFHVARHTFATSVTLSNGMPIETVSKLLGHTKLSTTQIYARIIDSKISEDFDMLSKNILAKNIARRRQIGE
jgi:integrase